MKTTITTILTICLLTLAGTQSLQAQSEDHTSHSLFMEGFWQNENLNTIMLTNQLLATKSGKRLIEDFEKGLKAVRDYNAGRISDQDYASSQEYKYIQAKRELGKISDELLESENEETRPLMDYYSELLVMDGWNANSWKEESVKLIEDDGTLWEDLTDSCNLKTKVSFSKDGSFIETYCSYDYDDDCDCETYSGKWHLSGTKLYLEFENEDDEGFLYIWFMNNKLYIMDEYMEQLIIFSRSDEK